MLLSHQLPWKQMGPPRSVYPLVDVVQIMVTNEEERRPLSVARYTITIFLCHGICYHHQTMGFAIAVTGSNCLMTYITKLNPEDVLDRMRPVRTNNLPRL